jgi:hypothetical protein
MQNGVWQIEHCSISVSFGKADVRHIIYSSELCREALNFATVVSAPFTVNYEHGGRKIATVQVEFDLDWLSEKMMSLAPFWCALLPTDGRNISSLDPMSLPSPLRVSKTFSLNAAA